MIGKCFVFGFRSRIGATGYVFKTMWCKLQAKEGLKLRQEQTKAKNKKGALDKYFNHWGIPSMTHNIEDGDNVVDNQPGHITLYSQSGSWCTRGDKSRIESVDSDKGTSSDGASDEACMQAYSKFGWTNNPTT